MTSTTPEKAHGKKNKKLYHWKAFMPNSMSASADYLTRLAFNVTWSESDLFV